MAKDYKLRINKYIENDLNPLMTLYLTENTDTDDMIKAFKNKTIFALNCILKERQLISNKGIKVTKYISITNSNGD